MHKKSLEVTCYVGGAGAFGVFARWLQDQMAFDETGLNEPSVWNFLVPVLMIATLIMAYRFTRDFKRQRYYLQEDFRQALANPGKLYAFIRWAIGVIMCAGAVLLLATCETDQDALLLQILAGLGFVTGLSFPLLLGFANREEEVPRNLLCIMHALPVIFFAFWLVVSYKMNDINSVVWNYVIEIFTVSTGMISFFRVAGFAYDTPKPFKAMTWAMFGAFMFIMAIADERYMGMQLMFLSAGLMLVLYNWIMIANLQQKPAPVKNYAAEDDGFDRLH